VALGEGSGGDAGARVIADYISHMTDTHATESYAEMRGMSRAGSMHDAD
jgi:dGTP triphosphohydrolase